MADLKRLSKFLSYILRHNPDEFGLRLDEEGFADFEAVWTQVEARFGGRYRRGDIERMLHSDGGRQRYQVRDGRIRAMYGHSVIPVVYPPVIPPEILYHGTVSGVLDAIKREGLTAQARQYVHLSTETDRAADVAGRHGKPIILRIRALEAYHNGLVFHNPEAQHNHGHVILPDYREF